MPETWVAIATNFFFVTDEDGQFWWKSSRRPNQHRDRRTPLEFIASWSDPLFYKAFRMTRCDFISLRESIKEVHRPRRVAMAVRSSGSMVSAETKLVSTWDLDRLLQTPAPFIDGRRFLCPGEGLSVGPTNFC